MVKPWAAGLVSLVLLLAGVAVPCQAEPLNGGSGSAGDTPPLIVGGGWARFEWNGLGTFNLEGPFTYTSSQFTRLRVTDAFVDGDQFLVYDNGIPIGPTSVPADDGFAGITDPDVAFMDPRYSHGEFILEPGSHAITMQTIRIATGFPAGAAFLRADVTDDPVIPEPSTLTLLGIGAISLIGYRWRRRKLAAS